MSFTKPISLSENFSNQRLDSLDALRGFDMFWIIGGEFIFHGMAKVTGGPFWNGLSMQFTHPDWNGFHAYDLIFPLFLFLAGVSAPFSLAKGLEQGKTKNELLLRIIKRGAILVLLGLFCNNGLQARPLAEIRFCSVLGRIGIAYTFACIIWLYASQRAQYVWFAALLVGYWLLLKFTSAPGFPHGDLTMPGNFASFIDRMVVPGKLYLGIHDPEGLVSAIPAISTGLLGILAGTLLKNNHIAPRAKVWQLVYTGMGLLALGGFWNLDFPINKNLWTSSFVLFAGGWSLLLLALFYYLIDVLGYKRWAFVFKVIGMNSILIYISSRIINWPYANNALFHWVGQLVGNPYNVVAMSVCFLVVKWLFLYFMYRHKVFLRV
jgi:predicted acyltransferase